MISKFIIAVLKFVIQDFMDIAVENHASIQHSAFVVKGIVIADRICAIISKDVKVTKIMFAKSYGTEYLFINI